LYTLSLHDALPILCVVKMNPFKSRCQTHEEKLSETFRNFSPLLSPLFSSPHLSSPVLLSSSPLLSSVSVSLSLSLSLSRSLSLFLSLLFVLYSIPHYCSGVLLF